MNDELVEAVAIGLARADPDLRMGDTDGVVEQRVRHVWRAYIPEAQAALAAIEASGFAVVPVGRPRCELVSGGTLDEIRANLSSELHATGDCVLVWMNEGDLIQIGFDAMLAAAPKAREG